MYARHIERWLNYFPSSQIVIIDGEELRSDPIYVMNDLQRFLGIQPFYNYTEHLRYTLPTFTYLTIQLVDVTRVSLIVRPISQDTLSLFLI